MQFIMQRTRMGNYAQSDNWERWLKAPCRLYPETKCNVNLIVPRTEQPIFVQPTGNEMLTFYSFVLKTNVDTGSDYQQNGNVITISQGKRKGFQLDLGLRRAKAARKDKVSPIDSAPPKYSSVPHPLLKLSRTALPAEVSEDHYERAVANFSCSVTKKVQTNYATAVRHYLAAEVELGRKFGSPPTQTEMVFLTTFLLGKGLKMDTVRSYLSAIRFYLLSQGVASPPRLPLLAEQLINGKAKANRNPNLVAIKKQRRAITIEMLSLLGHAISQRDDWSEHEKSLLWSNGR